MNVGKSSKNRPNFQLSSISATSSTKEKIQDAHRNSVVTKDSSNTMTQQQSFVSRNPQPEFNVNQSIITHSGKDNESALTQGDMSYTGRRNQIQKSEQSPISTATMVQLRAKNLRNLQQNEMTVTSADSDGCTQGPNTQQKNLKLLNQYKRMMHVSPPKQGIELKNQSVKSSQINISESKRSLHKQPPGTDPKKINSKTGSFLQKSHNAQKLQQTQQPGKGGPIVNQMYFPNQPKVPKKAKQTPAGDMSDQQRIKEFIGRTDSMDSLHSTTSMTGLNMEPRVYPKKHDCSQHQHTNSCGSSRSSQKSFQPIQKFKPRTTNRRTSNCSDSSNTSTKNQFVNRVAKTSGKMHRLGSLNSQKQHNTSVEKAARAAADALNRNVRMSQQQKPSNLKTNRSPDIIIKQHQKTMSNFHDSSIKRDQQAFQTTDYKQFQQHGNQMRQVQKGWEGNVQSDEYWGNPQRMNGDQRDIMSSVSMKSQTQSVLDQQKQIFNNLKTKNGQRHVNYRDVGDEVLSGFDDEAEDSMPEDPATFRENGNYDFHNVNLQPNAKMMNNKKQKRKVGDQEPQRPQMNKSKASQRITDQIEESDDEDEKEDTSHLNVTSYDDWLKSQQNKQNGAATDAYSDIQNSELLNDTTKAYSAVTQPYNNMLVQNQQLHPSQSRLPPKTQQHARKASFINEQINQTQQPSHLNNLMTSPSQLGSLEKGSPIRQQKQVQIKTSSMASPRHRQQQMLQQQDKDKVASPKPPLGKTSKIQNSLPPLQKQGSNYNPSQKSFLSQAVSDKQIEQNINLDESMTSMTSENNYNKGYSRPISYLKSQIANEEQQEKVKKMLSPRKNGNLKIKPGNTTRLNDHLSQSNSQANEIDQVNPAIKSPPQTQQLRGGQLRARQINAALRSKNASPEQQQQPQLDRQKTQVEQQNCFGNSFGHCDYDQASSLTHGPLQNDNHSNLINAQNYRQSVDPDTLRTALMTAPNFNKNVEFGQVVAESKRQRNENHTREDSLQSQRKVDQSRLYGHDTVSSKLKQNPRFAYNQSQQKPQIPKKAKKKQVLNSKLMGASEFDTLSKMQQSSGEESIEDGVYNDDNQFNMQSPQASGRPSVPFEPKESMDCEEPIPAEVPYDDYEYEMNNQIELVEMSEPVPMEEMMIPCEPQDALEYICRLVYPPFAPTIEQDQQEEKPEVQDPLAYPEDLEKTTNRNNSQYLNDIPGCTSEMTLRTEQQMLQSQKLELEDRQSNGCQAEFEESKASLQELSEEEENLYINSPGLRPNMCDAGIQTSQMHFNRIESTDAYQSAAEEKAFSTDWQLSSLYDDLQFKKDQNKNQIFPEQTEDCGMQVEERQIQQETHVQILSQIECEYNAEMLKRKQVSGAQTYAERTFELYVLGLNTLQALMYVLRLRKEWETVTKQQYELDLDFDGSIKKLNKQVSSDQCIKLLTRCKKMYEAKSMILRLLKMSIERDRLVRDIRKNRVPKSEQKNKLAQVKRMNQRVESQISALQEEHRIFKRPFIVGGKEYISNIKHELFDLEAQFKDGHFIDERGTIGGNYPMPQDNSSESED